MWLDAGEGTQVTVRGPNTRTDRNPRPRTAHRRAIQQVVHPYWRYCEHVTMQRPTVEALGDEEDNRQRFAIGPLEPGFGHTIGNLFDARCCRPYRALQ